jgi:hypothetical protein
MIIGNLNRYSGGSNKDWISPNIRGSLSAPLKPANRFHLQIERTISKISFRVTKCRVHRGTPDRWQCAKLRASPSKCNEQPALQPKLPLHKSKQVYIHYRTSCQAGRPGRGNHWCARQSMSHMSMLKPFPRDRSVELTSCDPVETHRAAPGAVQSSVARLEARAHTTDSVGRSAGRPTQTSRRIGCSSCGIIQRLNFSYRCYAWFCWSAGTLPRKQQVCPMASALDTAFAVGSVRYLSQGLLPSVLIFTLVTCDGHNLIHKNSIEIRISLHVC